MENKNQIPLSESLKETLSQLPKLTLDEARTPKPIMDELRHLRGLKQQLDSGQILCGNEGFSTEFYEVVETKTRPQPEECPKGDKCDLTIAYMVGQASNYKRDNGEALAALDVIENNEWVGEELNKPIKTIRAKLEGK